MAWIIRHGHGKGPQHPDIQTKSAKRQLSKAFMQARKTGEPLKADIDGRSMIGSPRPLHMTFRA